MTCSKNKKCLMEKILLIKKEDNINFVEVDDDINYINSNEILKLFSKNYKISKRSLGSGAQATVSDIGNNLVVRISRDAIYKEPREFIENNNKILSRLKGIKNGSTTPINTFVIVDKNKNFETIEIFKKREKGNLKEVRNKGEILPQIPLMEQLINALKNEHSAGIMHRDIKPGNILIDANNKATFGDFGLAATTDSKNLMSYGTPGYMAPESIEENPIINQQNDIYSLGIVFLENFLKKYNYSFSEFVNKEFERFCNTNKIRLNGEKPQTKFIIFNYKTNISEFIKEDIINLDNFLPKEILKNKKNKNKIEQLKTKLVDLLKHMVTKDLNNRYTIFEVKEKFDEIKRFMKKNLKWKNGSKVSIEDFLFLNKKQHINEEAKNRELYRMGVYNNDTVNAACIRLKNSLKSLSKEQRYQEPILWEKNSETLEDLKNGRLENLLQNLSKENPLSQEAVECFRYLNNCINENGNINTLCEGFYDKFESLRDYNIEEYLKVANKLSQLRELKIAVKIKELKKHKIINNKKIKKLKELRYNIRLVINVSKETKYSEIEEKLKELDKKQINFNGINYEDQEKIQDIDGNSDKDEDLSDRTKNSNNNHKEEEIDSYKRGINQEMPKIIFKREEEQTTENREKRRKMKEFNINNKQEEENNNDNDNIKKEVKRKSIHNINKNKQEKKEFNNNIKFKREREQTIENKIEEICSDKNDSEILIVNLLENNVNEERNNIINKIFDKALENNCINVINILFTKRYLDLNSRELSNKCIDTILNNINENSELSDALLNNIKNNNIILYISIINSVFSIAYVDNNREIINKLFSNDSISNFINLSLDNKEFAMPILEPIDIICNSNLEEDGNLVKNFVCFMNNNENNSKIDGILDIFYENNRLDTINKIFDIALENNCPNVLNKILTNKNYKKFFNLKIKDNRDLIYETIDAGKTEIAKILIENSVGFKEVNPLSNEIKIENIENFDILKRNIQELIIKNNQYNNDAKELKDNIKKLNKIKPKVKNRFLSIFFSKKPKYNYINVKDFNELSNLFNSVSNGSLNYRIN